MHFCALVLFLDEQDILFIEFYVLFLGTTNEQSLLYIHGICILEYLANVGPACYCGAIFKWLF